VVALGAVDHPLNILFPFVIEHVELFHDGNVHVLPGVHVTSPLFVPDALAHVPDPPFLFKIIDTLATAFFTGCDVPPLHV